MREGERKAALEQIAEEVRACTRCRLHQQRSRSVPGEGNPDTEVVFVGEGPGFNEDREGRPFVGRAGGLLVRLLASVGWQREDVFITNVVKCRPPENRDPEADEIAACAPFLRRQLEVLDPALVVTLGRFSMGTFMPGARIGQAHGTMRPVDPATGAADALVYAMYHPAAALRATEIEQASFRDMAGVPTALVAGRDHRRQHADLPRPAPPAAAVAQAAAPPVVLPPTRMPALAGPVPDEHAAPVAVSIRSEPRQPERPFASRAPEPSSPGSPPHGAAPAPDPADQLTLF